MNEIKKKNNTSTGTIFRIFISKILQIFNFSQLEDVFKSKWNIFWEIAQMSLFNISLQK